MRRYRAGLITVLFILTLSACGTLSYYAQSVSGQFRLMSRREPIAALLADPTLDAGLRQRLEQAREVRDFASSELALPDNGSYRSYVQLEHPFVVWSLFATPEFSLAPRQWCFPVAGCVPYRGYFAEVRAQAFARDLRAEGADVFIGGVPAYSTLGWFDDPLLSSMLLQGKTATASIIFHELAHQRVYVQDDAPFNEAFAATVEKAGVRRWLKRYGAHEELHAYRVAWRRRQDFFDLVEKTRARLAELYKTDAVAPHKRAAKQTIIADMRADYRELKRQWDGFGGYDYWFDESINNAKLAAVAVYRRWVPAFERLLTDCDGDFARFYREVAALAELDPRMRHTRLSAAQACS